ncbi:hypothetical protein WS94_23355 [Burkholderia territorii]|nr:hypothetical protein WS94_23355 [Burkholderia territorii]
MDITIYDKVIFGRIRILDDIKQILLRHFILHGRLKIIDAYILVITLEEIRNIRIAIFIDYYRLKTM